MKKTKGNSITVRPDTIVEARYQLTPRQNDTLDIILSEIRNDDDINKLIYRLELKKYIHIFPPGRRGNVYRDFKETVQMFEKNKGFKVFYNDGTTSEYFNWFSRIKYMDNEGEIEIEIGQTLKKLLVEMTRAAYYRPQFPISLISIYSKRIYYMLKQYEDTGFRIDNLDTLREKLECPPSYDKYGIFKNKVLETAKKEINEKTDMFIDYKPIKEKNKVVRIQFLITRKEEIQNVVTKLQLTEEDYNKLISYSKSLLPEDKINYAEEYLNNCIEIIIPEKIKSNKSGYIKKVVADENNISKFLEEKEKENNKNRVRQNAMEEQEKAEMVMEQEKEEKKYKLMEEYGVNSIEEVNLILSQKFNTTKN